MSLRTPLALERAGSRGTWRDGIFAAGEGYRGRGLLELEEQVLNSATVQVRRTLEAGGTGVSGLDGFGKVAMMCPRH